MLENPTFELDTGSVVVLNSFFQALFDSSELKNLMKYFDFLASTGVDLMGKRLLPEETLE